MFKSTVALLALCLVLTGCGERTTIIKPEPAAPAPTTVIVEKPGHTETRETNKTTVITPDSKTTTTEVKKTNQ